MTTRREGKLYSDEKSVKGSELRVRGREIDIYGKTKR
jgi:hypothetical protein